MSQISFHFEGHPERAAQTYYAMALHNKREVVGGRRGRLRGGKELDRNRRGGFSDQRRGMPSCVPSGSPSRAGESDEDPPPRLGPFIDAYQAVSTC